MPRGKRKTCMEKLEEIRAAISAQEAQLKELKQQERELLRQKKEEELRQIVEIMEERNMSPRELVEILNDSETEAGRGE